MERNRMLRYGAYATSAVVESPRNRLMAVLDFLDEAPRMQSQTF